ncbi:hypothetical protein AAHH97_04085 [Mycolicibacterium elephantis]|uniref:hypothetical protein n=1 Tax=Mycolicibacterium elephantis TaxID=81858 RepID=UPI003A85C1E2
MTDEENYVIALDRGSWAHCIGDPTISKSAIAEVEAVAATAGVPTMLEAWHDSFSFRNKTAIRAALHALLDSANPVTSLAGRKRKARFAIANFSFSPGKLAGIGAGASAKPRMHGT